MWRSLSLAHFSPFCAIGMRSMHFAIWFGNFSVVRHRRCRWVFVMPNKVGHEMLSTIEDGKLSRKRTMRGGKSGGATWKSQKNRKILAKCLTSTSVGTNAHTHIKNATECSALLSEYEFRKCNPFWNEMHAEMRSKLNSCELHMAHMTRLIDDSISLCCGRHSTFTWHFVSTEFNFTFHFSHVLIAVAHFPDRLHFVFFSANVRGPIAIN